MCTDSLQLIGLLHGPSDENNALDRQQSIQTKLLALAQQNEFTLPWEDGETVFKYYQDEAYQDDRALILRDAGVICAFFTLLLVLVSNFTSTSYSASQRLWFSLLALPLYFAPGFLGQIVFQKTIPVEIALFKTWGAAKGMSYIGYCSLKGLLVGLGDGPSTYLTTIHDLKVVGSASFLVFVMLGVTPGK